LTLGGQKLTINWPMMRRADVCTGLLKDLLPGQHGKVAEDNRLFLDAVLWIAVTGASWRDLPERLGNWNSVWRRFDRWAEKGVWRRVFDALQDPDLEWVILNSTVVRAHQDVAGAPKNGTAVVAKPIRPWGGAGADSGPRSISPSTPSVTPSSSS
jgi:transposase